MMSRLAHALQSSNRRVVRNGIFSLAQGVCGIGTYFLVMRYVTTTVGLEGVGLWSLTMGFVALIRIMDLTGANGLARMVAIHHEDEGSQASTIDTMTVFIIVLYVLLSLIAFYPLQNAISSTLEPETRSMGQELLIWAIIALPINVVGLAQSSAIDGVGRADIRSILNISGFFVYGVLSVIFIPVHGVLGLAYAQVIQYTLMALSARAVLVIIIGPLRLMPVHFSRKAAAENLRYGFRLQASTIPLALFDSSTRILIGKWAGLDFLGLYDLSSKLAIYTRALLQASVNPLVPEFSRLWRTDKSAARAYHADVSVRTVRAVALAFSLVILASPAFSFFLLAKISPEFIFSVAVLSLGWGLASFGLITQLYARAAGLLRWSIFGQWLLLALGVTVLYFTARSSSVYIPITVGLVVAVGHLVAFTGETRALSLAPFGESHQARRAKLILTGFLAFGLVAAILPLLLLL